MVGKKSLRKAAISSLNTQLKKGALQFLTLKEIYQEELLKVLKNKVEQNYFKKG